MTIVIPMWLIWLAVGLLIIPTIYLIWIGIIAITFLRGLK